MATRIENAKKIRRNKRPQGELLWDISDAAFVAISTKGKIPRLDQRGFPASFGADKTAVKYTTQA